MIYETIKKDFSSIKNIKTKDIDSYNKKLIKRKENVSFLKEYCLEDPFVYRTYFQVSLAQIDTYEEQFKFIEDNFSLLNDWWHVDQLTQFIHRPINFKFAVEKSKQYLQNKNPFVRRWAYVLFLIDLQKNPSYTPTIFTLLKDDDEYYVQMAEAWLLADLAVYSFEEVFLFIKNSSLKYNILGKAIQKMCDSYRISKDNKNRLRSLREKLKLN